MHEVAIVQTLIEQVEDEVRNSGHDGRVLRLQLSIGRLSGVHADAIRFALELLAPGTVLEGADIDIDEPRASCRCRQCKRSTVLEELVYECPACQSHDFSVEGGQDMLLQTIELED